MATILERKFNVLICSIVHSCLSLLVRNGCVYCGKACVPVFSGVVKAEQSGGCYPLLGACRSQYGAVGMQSGALLMLHLHSGKPLLKSNSQPPPAPSTS